MYKKYFKTATFCFFIMAFGFFNANAQVGIGNVAPASTLDITATNPTGATTNVDGILIPRVDRQRAGAMTAIPNGTMIFVNSIATGTATLINTNITATGFYFFDTSALPAPGKWIASGSDKNWSTVGNTGTTATNNFIGTTDAVDLVVRTNNTEKIRVASGGNVGIGIAPSTYKFDVASGAGDAIFGHSTNVGGILGYETNFTVGGAGTLQGAGVYASNPTAGYTSSFAQSTGAATVAANINYSTVWIPSFNYAENSSNTQNPPALYAQLNNTGTTLTGFQNAIRGLNNRATTAGNIGYSVGVNGTSSSQFQDSFGVIGLAYCDTATKAGGYFEANTYVGTNNSYSYVATNFGGTARKITGTASVSEIVPTEKHGRVTLTCPESPEYWYQDYGTVQMVNGKATILLDEILADVSVIDDENPIRVICTPVAMPYFNGVTIMSQTNKSVEILELNGGNHSGKLQYQLVVKPKTNYGEGRFQQAPGPAYLKADKEPIAAKAKNQPNDGRKIFHWPSDPEVYKYNPEDFVGIGDIIPGGPNGGKVKLGNGKYGDGLPLEKPKK
jgi:hypothetical protein